MLKFFKRVWMGAGYLEGYGEHPGNLMLFVMMTSCGLAGVEKGGLRGFIGGAIIGAVFILPMYFMGCVSRAKMYEQDMEETMQRLKKDYNG